MFKICSNIVLFVKDRMYKIIKQVKEKIANFKMARNIDKIKEVYIKKFLPLVVVVILIILLWRSF